MTKEAFDALNKQRGFLRTNKVKETDARADKIDATIVQGRKNREAKEAIDTLDKRRDFCATKKRK
jgi:hypothetical protein